MNIQALTQSLAAGQSGTGQMAIGEVEELQKALTAGYGSDTAALTGAGALRIQSLDTTMKATIQDNEHFALFNELQKLGAGATVDEWTEQSSVGGFLGGSTNTETGTISSAQGDYKRRVALVKYLMTKREVSFVATLGKNLAEIEAVEAQNGALQLLTDAEFLCFEGDSNVVPTEFDGLAAQIGQSDNVDHVLDAAGTSLASVNSVLDSTRIISSYGNFGRASHIFMSQGTQNDFDKNLDPAWRVALNDVPNGGTQIGSPVVGIRTSQGNLKTKQDVFIRDETQLLPFQMMYPAIAAKNLFAPASVEAVAAAGSASSAWKAPQAGNFYYAVAGVNASGQSAVVVTAQVAVAQGGKVTLTIGASASGEETGYVIYRGRQNGTNALSDLRQMIRIPRTGAQTVFVDENRDIPGTTSAYILSLNPQSQALDWRQLLPMMKFALYPTSAATIPWAQLMFGYLRVAKRKHHTRIKNIVTASQLWRPFN